MYEKIRSPRKKIEMTEKSRRSRRKPSSTCYLKMGKRRGGTVSEECGKEQSVKKEKSENLE